MVSNEGSGKPTMRRYSPEEKAAAVRMVRILRAELGTEHGTVQRVATQLGYGIESVRTWVKQADIDDGNVAGVTTAESRKLRELEQEVRELRRANEMADSSGGRNEFCELLRWCQIAERFAWSSVERVLDRGQLSAGDDAQIGALRQVLA